LVNWHLLISELSYGYKELFFLSGKLGHGDTKRVYKPKMLEAFNGLYIRKVVCGSQSSLALTSTGQVRIVTLCLLSIGELFSLSN
jgi:alpha-tubulin suppressor-like RCC1 family protein